MKDFGETAVRYTRNILHKGMELLSQAMRMREEGDYPLVRILHCAALALAYGHVGRELTEMLLSLNLIDERLGTEFIEDAYGLIAGAEAEFDLWEQAEHYGVVKVH